MSGAVALLQGTVSKKGPMKGAINTGETKMAQLRFFPDFMMTRPIGTLEITTQTRDQDFTFRK